LDIENPGASDADLDPFCVDEQPDADGGDEDEGDVDMLDDGARTPLSPAVQRTVAAIVIRLASRAQYSKVCSCHGVERAMSTSFLGGPRSGGE
jgi:hypothetical protein